MEIANKSSFNYMKALILNFIKRIKKLGKDDPRRIVHSFKVALAITLVSMVYYLRPLYKGFGDNGVWAILTVVVVFEYTAGATLCKGMNRGLATLVAGLLGIGAKYLASLFGTKAEPIVLGCLVFLLGFGGEIFELPLEGDGDEPDKSFLAAYKSVLNSKATEESLANFAWWEPGHGKFRFCHPWKQYLKIGVLTRQCGYHIEALNGYLNAKFQVSSEFTERVQEPCTKMSYEAGKALKELALSVKSFSYPSNCTMHLQTCQKAVDELNTTLKASMVGEFDVLEIIPIITIASILIEIVKCVETIFVAIEELSEQAHFKKLTGDDEKSQVHHGGAVANVGDEEEDRAFVKVIVHKITSESRDIEDNRG
ncbi:hypothetical protein L1987_33588 [Smallanthus sonchifolius]|uniref:Uncharacterized protein n=1 Tax=Smallanthus sonchifolius TaxID=185202 RepID=A0ACB9HRV5_9ASTR|nr:hypothetical protein L1987_33588 [Smallanthus sonchifolius]